MTLGQGHDTLLGYGQQLCEILSRFNLAVRSYGEDTDFWCVHCDLDLENCVKYYPDQTNE